MVKARTPEERRKLIEELQKEERQYKEENLMNAREDVEKYAYHKWGFSLGQLVNAGKVGIVRYKNPETGDIYSRGPRPKWLKDHIDSGGKKEDFIVKN